MSALDDDARDVLAQGELERRVVHAGDVPVGQVLRGEILSLRAGDVDRLERQPRLGARLRRGPGRSGSGGSGHGGPSPECGCWTDGTVVRCDGGGVTAASCRRTGRSVAVAGEGAVPHLVGDLASIVLDVVLALPLSGPGIPALDDVLPLGFLDEIVEALATAEDGLNQPLVRLHVRSSQHVHRSRALEEQLDVGWALDNPVENLLNLILEIVRSLYSLSHGRLLSASADKDVGSMRPMFFPGSKGYRQFKLPDHICQYR